MKNFGLIFGLFVLINVILVRGQDQYYTISEVYQYPNCTGITGYNVYVTDACFFDGDISFDVYWQCNSTTAQRLSCLDATCDPTNCVVTSKIPFGTCTTSLDSVVGNYEMLIGCWEDDKPSAFPTDIYLAYEFYNNPDCKGDPFNYAYTNGGCYYDATFQEYYKNECGSDGIPIVYECGQSQNCSSCVKSSNPYGSFCYGFSGTLGMYIRCGPVESEAIPIEFSKLLIMLAMLIGILGC